MKARLEEELGAQKKACKEAEAREQRAVTEANGFKREMERANLSPEGSEVPHN